jgi:tetratricopeptide (TPR) repeat protein
MSVRWCAGALVLGCSGALLATAQQPASQQQPVFRTDADLVTVPVSVRASGTPVGGLKPDDFVVLDNGVPQKVESIDGESVAADITILVETGQTMKPYLGLLSEQVKRISAMLRPADRLEVLGIDTYINELLPLKAASQQPALGKLPLGGSLVSVNDALIAALLREPDKQRPHLVIAITDTIDSMSIADMATVRDVAKESGATLVIAWVTLSEDPAGGADPLTHFPYWNTTSEREKRARGAMIVPPHGTDATVPQNPYEPGVTNGNSVPRARYWIPHTTPRLPRTIAAFDLLKEAAETTGGALHPPGVFTDRNAAVIFNKVYDDYRHSYVLRYMPTGVARDGWHEIMVTTPKFPSYELKARRGYFVEAGKAPAAKEATAPVTLAPFEALLKAGEEGNYDEAGRIIRENAGQSSRLSLINDFIKAGNVFPATPRREFLVALQLSEASLPSLSANVVAGGYALLTRHSGLLPQVEGYDGFERYWRAAALALAQAPVRPANAAKLLKESLAKFPDEPRFVLASAVLADQEWIIGDITSPTAPVRRAPEIIRLYDAAIALETTRAEASIRKAWFLNRMGRRAEALTLIEGAAPLQQDLVLCYWRELLRGKILDDLGRSADAIQSFRAALAISPEAQSARVGLMNAFARVGQREDARVIADAIATARADAQDPWRIYWQADYRWFPTLFARLAEFAK